MRGLAGRSPLIRKTLPPAGDPQRYARDKNVQIDTALLRRLLHGQSTIYAQIFDDADITFDIWPSESDGTVDLEVWFWADQFFPGDDRFNFSRFESLIRILKDIVGRRDVKCILTAYEASDPREDLKNGHAVELRIKKA